MAVMSSVARSSGRGFGRRSYAGLTLALLTASVAAPGSGWAASPPAVDQATSLDRLSSTLGDLKTSLTALRQGLEGMRSAPEAAAGSPPDASCPPPAEPAATAEGGARELVQLRRERVALKERIVELEQMVKQARTGEVVTGLVKGPEATPIETAAAAELKAPGRSGSVLETLPPADSPAAVAADAPAGADGGDTQQLQADLALARAKITDLSEELTSTRAHQAALEAELKSLRSLTDAKIKQFMGWQ